MTERHDSWLTVRGGPYHGFEFLPGDDPKPGRRVVINREIEFLNCGWYAVTVDGAGVEWEEDDA